MQQPLQYSTARRSWGYTPPMFFSETLRFENRLLEFECFEAKSTATKEKGLELRRKCNRFTTNPPSRLCQSLPSPSQFRLTINFDLQRCGMRLSRVRWAFCGRRLLGSLADRWRRATHRSLENSTAVASSQISWLSQKKHPKRLRCKSLL